MTEEWKDVVGFEGFYHSSSYGRVRSVKRKKIMKLNTCHKDGYVRIRLSKHGKTTDHTVHRLIASSFVIIDDPLKNEVMHLNDNKLDNRSVNLAWGSRLDNEQDKVSKGRQVSGEDSHFSKLTEDSAIKIKKLLKEGALTQSEIAGMFNINQANVSCIKLNKTWKYV
tara:strand:- start:1212 stop:1712 length:501 start_codon:yes stop_codon:yes gene_type:complete